MGNFEVLARRFAEANLRAEVVESQIQRAARWASEARAGDVFRMTILGKGRNEYFRVWPGARTNRVEAEGIDRDRRQLVLMVHEPVRTFEERLSKRRVQLDPTKVKWSARTSTSSGSSTGPTAGSGTSCAGVTNGSCAFANCLALSQPCGTRTRCFGHRK